ncbi:S-adenosyl-L-methionine-dependent methyltransferase [Obelidium mucronatum]|nr:S-adenosyl-L-methionine-dependent methyltransferase [Obelidium mucronatum]
MQVHQRSSRLWVPSQYLRFGGERLRPALDLLMQARISLQQSQRQVDRILDLGCGTGNITPFLREAWPNAAIDCVDSSPEMLNKAKASHDEQLQNGPSMNITYHQADFESFQLNQGEEKVDLIYSNAALHWVSFDVHQTLIPRLMKTCLSPGGVLAFQIPDTRAQNSHLLMKEAAKELGLADCISKTRCWVTCEKDPQDYYNLLQSTECVSKINMWHSKYAMLLEGENPVADFTASTGLGPYVDAVGGKDSVDGKAFIAKYRELISKAYPKTSDGKTVFEFNRFFVVATKE